jgi:hypothetical protein
MWNCWSDLVVTLSCCISMRIYAYLCFRGRPLPADLFLFRQPLTRLSCRIHWPAYLACDSFGFLVPGAWALELKALSRSCPVQEGGGFCRPEELRGPGLKESESEVEGKWASLKWASSHEHHHHRCAHHQHIAKHTRALITRCAPSSLVVASYLRNKQFYDIYR